ncbi:MAG: IPT/TIG domain-containing protein [Armatimonadota bacterium]
MSRIFALKSSVWLALLVMLITASPAYSAAPNITSFTPTSAKIGQTVTIAGTFFTGATSVAFNGTSADIYTVNNISSITATVPRGATTGKISVTTAAGIATSASDFTVIPAPIIDSFAPTSGKVGQTVTITGTNFYGATSVKFNGTATTFTIDSDSYITTKVPSGATTGTISVATPSIKATSANIFTVYYLPTISSFDPDGGVVGQTINITGTNFAGATSVEFNGTPASSYTIKSATTLLATVPDGATTGPITVVSPFYRGSSAKDFVIYETLGIAGTIDVWGQERQVAGIRNGYVAATARDQYIAGLDIYGSVSVWGSDGLSNVPSPNNGFTAIDTYNGRIVGLKRDGSIVCWGNNGGLSSLLIVPKPNTDFTAVAAGQGHTVGLKNDRSVVCWGDNSLGQLNIPVPNQDFTAISAGSHHSIGLKQDGSVVCWGDNGNRQLDVPYPNKDFTAVVAGEQHSIGLKNDGTIICWGWNGVGQCDVPYPNKDFVAIAAGERHSVGLKIDGTIVCWGENGYGQCTVPQPNSGFIAIAAGGGYSTIAIRSVQAISGQIQLSDFSGSISSQQFTAEVKSASDPSIMQTLSLTQQGNGNFNLSTYLQPPYDIRISGSHFLALKVTNVSSEQSLNIALMNGDADGDGQINLFDFVVLDTQFGHPTAMSDLDGDGQVNLFDYVVIDQNFGAQGD